MSKKMRASTPIIWTILYNTVTPIIWTILCYTVKANYMAILWHLPPRCVLMKLREDARREGRLPLPNKRRSQGAEERASADTQPQPPRASESSGRTRSWSLLFQVVVVVTLYSTVKYQSARCAEGLEGITFLPLCIIIRGFPKGKTICKLYCGNEVVSCFPWSF